MKTPSLLVDLDDWGEQTIDFEKSVNISADYTAELHKNAAQYDYMDSVLQKLKLVHSQKDLYLEKFSAKKYAEIEEFLKSEGGKVTIKAIDSAVANDEEIYVLKEELLVLHNQIDRIRGHIGALSHKHSNLKELSRRERWNLSVSNYEVSEEEPEEMPVKQSRTGKKSRKRKELK